MSRSDWHARLLRRWYGERPVIWLVPLSALFVALAGVRRWAYRRGLLRVVRLPAPVIVVGNITVGGTGKTPFVIWLCEALRARGYRPGVVTRGYGGAARRWPQAVHADSDPLQVGDEAVLLARRARVPVAAGADRVAAARLVLQSGVDVIVSDDGLQHYSLGRDVEIILLDAVRGLGNRWRLPAGPLREAPDRLASADLVIAKAGGREAQGVPAGALRMSLAVDGAVSLVDGRTVPLESFAGRRVHALAGIGNPQQFFDLLAAHGLDVDARALPDHARPAGQDLAFADADPVFMTEKDAIKCRTLGVANAWYLKVSARFSADDAARILACVCAHLPAACARPQENI